MTTLIKQLEQENLEGVSSNSDCCTHGREQNQTTSQIVEIHEYSKRFEKCSICNPNCKNGTLLKSLEDLGLHDWFMNSFSNHEIEFILKTEEEFIGKGWYFPGNSQSDNLTSISFDFGLSFDQSLNEEKETGPDEKILENSKDMDDEYTNVLVEKTKEGNFSEDKINILESLANLFNKKEHSSLNEKFIEKLESEMSGFEDLLKFEKRSYIYQTLFSFYYKKRNDDPLFYEKSKKILELDISIFPMRKQEIIDNEKKEFLYLKSLNDEYLEKGEEPFMSKKELASRQKEIENLKIWDWSFKQLSIIYEKEKKFDKAIFLCNKAVNENCSGDFNERIQRLEKKLGLS